MEQRVRLCLGERCVMTVQCICNRQNDRKQPAKDDSFCVCGSNHAELCP